MTTVLLDLDGTLTNPAAGITRCIRHAFAELGREPPPSRTLGAWIGPPLLASFRAALGSDELAERALRAYRERFADVGWQENELIDGIVEPLCRLCEADCRLILATSKPRIFAARIVKHFGLDAYLAAVRGSELDGRLGDKAELLSTIVPARSRERFVMVGDRHHDIDGAKAVGISSVGVLWGFGSEAELIAAGADRIVGVPSALAGCILDWPPG